MRNLITSLFSFLFAIQQFSLAQITESEIALATAVKLYNETNDYVSALTIETIDDLDIYEIESYIADADFQFDIVKQKGTEEEKKVARYFELNFNYELGFAYGMMGENELAYIELAFISNEIEYFSNSAVFPLKYKYNNTTYAINFDNFSSTLGEYYSSMLEISANTGFNEEAYNWGKKALNLPSINEWLKYICLYRMIEVKSALNQWDREMVDYSLLQIEAVLKLDEANKKVIKDYNYPTENKGANSLLSALQKNPSLSDNGSKYSQAAKMVIQLNNSASALALYKQMITDDNADVMLLNEALTYFQEVNRSDKSLWDSAQNGTMHGTAYKAAFKLESMLNSNSPCIYWSSLYQSFLMLNLLEDSQRASKKYGQCINDEKKQERKENRKNSSEFGLYVGAYPIPMIWGNFGALTQIQFNKIGLELSYTKVGHDRDYQPDFYNPIAGTKEYFDPYGNELEREKVYWDGSRINGAVKFTLNEESDYDTYFSITAGRVSKTYEPFLTTVINATTNATVAYGTISPTEIKYTLMLGGGIRSFLSDRWMMDLSFGIGVSKPTFSVDSPYYKNPDYLFLSNLVQSSSEPGIGMAGHLNLSIGYYIFSPNR
jgi:hypothetical protein